MTPADWVKAAELDLATARSLVHQEKFAAPVAFHAQQAAEKSLKALILAHREKLTKIHDLQKLAKEAGVTQFDLFEKLKYPDRFYHPTRYRMRSSAR